MIRKLTLSALSGIFVFLSALFIFNAVVLSQGTPREPPHAYIPESRARRYAVNIVLPEFPQEAVERGNVGLLVVKLEIDPAGNVLKVKVRPETDAVIKKTVAETIPQWRFRMSAPANYTETTLTRLTFRYFIEDSVGRVELYTPPPNAEMTERLDYMHSLVEGNEWRAWEQVYPRKPASR